MKLTQLGTYTMSNGDQAQITWIEDGFAYGFNEKERWNADTGCHNHSEFDIVSRVGTPTSEQLNDKVAELEQDIIDAIADGEGSTVDYLREQIAELDVELDAACETEEFISEWFAYATSPYANLDEVVLGHFASALLKHTGWDVVDVCGWDSDPDYDAPSFDETYQAAWQQKQELKK